MVRDLDWPLELAVVPTVREPDGLALSSRNAQLSADERGSAAALPKALNSARETILAGSPVSTALASLPAVELRRPQLRVMDRVDHPLA